MISATVYVSAVNCRAIARGSYAGQESGVELTGTYRRGGATGHPADFAGVYTYCHGHIPEYRAEFVTLDEPDGRYVIAPAHVLGSRTQRLAVRPGDPLKILIVSHGAGLTLRIFDVNTDRTAILNAHGSGRRAGWAAGTLPIFASAAGAPVLHGTLQILDLYSPTVGPATLAGPVYFPPVVFDSLRVDGRVPTDNHEGAHESNWVGGGGKPVANVTRLRHGNFISAPVVVEKPVLGRKLDVAYVSGTVLIHVPGKEGYVRLNSVGQIPNNSDFDVTNGHVQVTLGLPHGKSETGIFSDGEFNLHQNPDGNAVLTLAGRGQTSDCSGLATTAGTATTSTATEGTATADTATASAARGVAQVAKAKPAMNKPARDKPAKNRASLWSNAHGDFTTKGSAGAAAVLGTEWFTENECGGTYFRVTRDKIKVTAYYPTVHTVIVTAGHSYFARGPVPAIHIAPVSPTDGRYDVQTGGNYSITVVSPTRPAYVDAAVAPQQPSGSNAPFFPDGTVKGVPRWRIVFHITPDLAHFQNWNVGVELAGQLYAVPLRVS